MVPALTARKLGMTPRMRFGCGGGVFCAAGFALSDCCPAACVPLGCVLCCSVSAALPPTAVVDNAAPESCESASAVIGASCANENRAPPQITAPVRNSAPIRRKPQPPYPKQTYPESDASSGHEVTRTLRKASRADSTTRSSFRSPVSRCCAGRYPARTNTRSLHLRVQQPTSAEYW